MKLWIVSELFFPNESATAFILTKIAAKLSKRFDVHVITIHGNYESDGARISKQENNEQFPFETIRIKAASMNKNSLPKRIIRFIDVSRKLYKELSSKVSENDIVLTVTNPAFFILLLKKLKKKVNFKYYLLAHDIFPENLVPAGICSSGNPLYKILVSAFDNAYSSADRLIVLGRDMKDILCRKTRNKVEISVVENWGDTDIIPAKPESKDHLILQYAGNIGRVQGIKALIKIIEGTDNPFLRYHFYGGGSLAATVKNHESRYISYHGSYSRNEQQNILNASDIAIVTLAKGMKGLGVPSKSYNIMAAGKPILFIGDPDSEIALTIKEHSIGWVFDFDDSDGIREFLLNLSETSFQDICKKGKKARMVCEELFSEKIILDKFDKLF